MNDMARIVTNPAGGQLVELPEGFRFDGAEVRVWRDGERVVLEPADLKIDKETGLPLTELRRLIREGIESGDAGVLDMAKIKREARAAWEVRRV